MSDATLARSIWELMWCDGVVNGMMPHCGDELQPALSLMDERLMRCVNMLRNEYDRSQSPVMSVEPADRDR